MNNFFFNTGKKFGVTDFVNAGDCGNKSVSQVNSYNCLMIMFLSFILLSIINLGINCLCLVKKTCFWLYTIEVIND